MPNPNAGTASTTDLLTHAAALAILSRAKADDAVAQALAAILELALYQIQAGNVEALLCNASSLLGAVQTDMDRVIQGPVTKETSQRLLSLAKDCMGKIGTPEMHVGAILNVVAGAVARGPTALASLFNTVGAFAEKELSAEEAAP